jgi:regulatory protein
VSQSPRPKPGPSREKPSVSLRARALRLLARREHTRLELKRKLAAHAEDGGEVENLLEELTARGWLAEARVAEQVIHTRRGRFGSRRIREELLARGVAEEIVAAALPQLKESELDAARAIWRRKFKAPPLNRAEHARQVRFMQGRGFRMDTILTVMRTSGTDDENA